jgi:uncharacterized protein YqhQ
MSMRETSVDQIPYGGQAVIEGVMMRGQRSFAVAVRAPSNEIVVWTEETGRSTGAQRLQRIPFVRGPVMLGEAISLGVRALIFSARIASASESKIGSQPAPWRLAGASLGLAAGIFFVLPLLITALTDPFVASPLASNVIEGVIRLGLLVGYIWGIGFLPDVQRVFGYHGAEHKAIHAWEADGSLETASVQRHPLEHPRCGTGFMLVIALMSMVVFAMFGRPDLWLRIPSRVLLLPVLAALAYEFLKFGARRPRNSIVRIAMLPGLRLQRLTTREPDPGMVEVAVAAFAQVLAYDGQVVMDSHRFSEVTMVDEHGRPLTQDNEFEPAQPMAAD